MKLSGLFTLGMRDWVNGLIMTVGGAIFAVLESSFQAGVFTIDWNNVWHVALGAVVVYLGKNLFTPVPKTIVIDSTKTTVVDSTK